jgi:carbonic anhydrase
VLQNDDRGGSVAVTDELLARNLAYAERFEGAALEKSPRLKLAVLACMDARLDPYALLGIGAGDAHLLRNAGGNVTDDAIRSLAISQHLLGTEEVIVIRHTDCGMQSFTDEEFAERLERTAGRRPDWSGGAFADLEGDLRASLERLRESPFLLHPNVRGFVFDVETGRLGEVV